MPLGREVGLSPGDIVLYGDPAPLPRKGMEPPIFGPCLLWLIVGLDSGHMLDGYPVPLVPKGAHNPPICGRYMLWLNEWMGRDATW